MPRRSKMMKKMKSMSEEAAAVRRLVLLSDEDDELNVQQEWEKSFFESLLKQEKVEKAGLQIRT